MNALNLSSPLPPVPPARAAAPAAGPAAAPAASPGGFAKALQQAQGPRRDAERPDAKAAEEPTADSDDTGPGAEALDIDKTPAAADHVDGSTLPATPPVASPRADPLGDPLGEPLADPRAASALAMPPAADGEPARPGPAAGPAGSGAVTAAAAQPAADLSQGSGAGGDPGGAANPGQARAAPAEDAARPSSAPLTESAPALSTAQAANATAGGVALAAQAATAAGASPTAGGEAQRLSAPLHSPAFAPELGAQLRMMVKEGQAEARLHLNPAEMGPIQVRIMIDGSQARVDMAAELAQTRQVLEQAMPALAGALRESGLTLAGGGVFEQGRDPRQPPGQPGGRGPGPSADGDAPGAEPGLPGDPMRGAQRARGVLDLYA